MSEPTVFIVDDDPAVRKSLRWLIESVGLSVDTFESGNDFLDALTNHHHGCLVLDVRLPGISGLELLERLNERDSHLPVIVITGHADVPMAVRAMKHGAVDFIEKPFSDQLLLERIQQAMADDAQHRQDQADVEKMRRRADHLTAREREVMRMVVDGKANKQIAAELHISQKTVEVHRARVMSKMEADSVADLVRMNMVAGLVADRA
jgi:two-component system response regulator FixJ